MELKTAEEVLRTEGIFIGNEVIGGIKCAVGYEKVFKWSWLATQLNTFVIIGATDQLIDKNVIEQFSRDCFEYAIKNNKGWPRGLQAGVASITILQGKSIDRSAAVFCEKLTKKHWSAFEIPILYHTESKKPIKYLVKPIWGTIYFSHFSKLIDSITSKF